MVSNFKAKRSTLACIFVIAHNNKIKKPSKSFDFEGFFCEPVRTEPKLIFGNMKYAIQGAGLHP